MGVKLIVFIKIYPEWNVNIKVDLLKVYVLKIKIYPEWNVNVTRAHLKAEEDKLKSTQSGM